MNIKIKLNEIETEFLKKIEDITDVDYDLKYGETDVETLLSMIGDLKILIDSKYDEIEELKDQMNNSKTRDEEDYEETRYFMGGVR